jgi:hypothetical protein
MLGLLWTNSKQTILTSAYKVPHWQHFRSLWLSNLPTDSWNPHEYQLCPYVSRFIFIFLYEAEFIQKLLHEKNLPLVVAFNSQFRYIDNVLSINNDHFHSYVDSIYHNELEIKDTTESSTSASYFVKHGCWRKTNSIEWQKRDDFNFAIVNFPYTWSNIPLSPANGVYISQLIRYEWACSETALHTISFLSGGRLLTDFPTFSIWASLKKLE